jgi:hypothetical protein
MSNSKKNVYILSTNHNTSRDRFRDATGNYWTTPGETPEYGDMVSRARKIGPDKIKSKNKPRSPKKKNLLRIIPRNQRVEKTKDAPFYEIFHKFEIYSDKEVYGNIDEWASFIKKNIKIGKTYKDYSVEIHNPLSENELEGQNYSPSAIFEKVNFDYNYYSNIYEITTNNAGSKENILPNLYFFAENQDSEDMNEAFEAITAGGQLSPRDLRSLRKSKFNFVKPPFFDNFGRAQRNMPARKKKRLVEKASNVIFETKSEDLLKKAEDLFSLFPMGVDIQFMSDFMNEFTEILEDSKLSTSLLGYLATIPEDPTGPQTKRFSIDTLRMKRYFEKIGNPKNRNPKVEVDFENITAKAIDLFSWWQKVSEGMRVKKRKVTVLGDKKDEDISKFERFLYLMVFSGKLQTMIKKHQRSYLDISDGDLSYSETFCYKIEKSLESGAPIQTIWMPNTNEIDLIRYIDTQVKYNRTYKYKITAYQIVMGSEYEYNNIEFPEEYNVGSRRKKRVKQITKPGGGVTLEVDADITPAEVEIPSNLLAPGISGGNEGTLGVAIGTKQVNLSKIPAPGAQPILAEVEDADFAKRKFEVITPTLEDKEVFGLSDRNKFNTKYANRLFVLAKKREKVDDEKYFRATMEVRVRPSIKIVELPFFEIGGRVIDDPPVPPHVDIIPYRGVNNQLLINLNTNVGRYDLHPVILSESDRKIVDEIRQAKRLPPDSKITYSTDDPTSAFEVYRMSTPPQKIEDFSGNLRSVLETDIDATTAQKASSASMKDSLSPNVDYYYTFRAIDIHGKKSNPTEVYRVKVIDNDGAVYTIVELYEMKKIKPQKPTKKGKKLLNIVPRFTQTLINENKSKMGDGSSAFNVKSVILGQEDESLFGERFKVRLTSMKTGKKIDINIDFNVELEQRQK